MYSYETVSEALDGLKKRGYQYDFNLNGAQLLCTALQKAYCIDDVQIDETYRFEGPTDPADEAVVYAVQGNDGTKGVFVDGYGAYYDGDSLEFLQHLHQRATGR